MKNSAPLLFLPLLLAACFDANSGTPPAGGTTPPAAQTTAAAATASQDSAVSIHNFAFSPTAVTVAAGTTVKWKNLDGEPHTVRAIDGSFKSEALDQDDSFSFKFDKPGTYRYVCSIHPQMNGTIVVKPPGSK